MSYTLDINTKVSAKKDDSGNWWITNRTIVDGTEVYRDTFVITGFSYTVEAVEYIEETLVASNRHTWECFREKNNKL